MKIITRFALLVLLLSVFTTQNILAQSTKGKMENKSETVSYALGILLEANLKSQGFEGLNFEILAKAMEEASKNKPQVNVGHAQVIVQDYQKAAMEKKSASIIAEGTKFLADNAKKEGVVSLPSGLQYKVLIKGEGEKPTATNKVKVD